MAKYELTQHLRNNKVVLDSLCIFCVQDPIIRMELFLRVKLNPCIGSLVSPVTSPSLDADNSTAKSVVVGECACFILA